MLSGPIVVGRLRWLAGVAALAISMTLGGVIAFGISPPPIQTSLFWPPAGIAVAGLMLWGVSLWPGVWAGALLSELYALSKLGIALDGGALTVAALIALGSSGQAALTAWMTRKWLTCDDIPRLDTLKQILRFIALCGPLTCILSATLGVWGFWILDLVPTDQWLSEWRNWWLGDSLGAVLLTPMIFCAFASPRELWRPRLFSVALPMTIALLALNLMFNRIYHAEQARTQLEFDSQASAIGHLFVDYANNVVESTRMLQNFFLSSDYVSRSEFRKLTRAILDRHPEIQSLAWRPRVALSERAAFEARMRAEGYADFRVTDRIDGQRAPSQPREVYFPVEYIEPEAGNLDVLGLDLDAQSDSRPSKHHAPLDDAPTVSPRIPLMHRVEGQWGVQVSIPVFADPHRTRPQPATADGVISAVLLPKDMVNMALSGLGAEGFGIIVRDLSAPASWRELFRRPARDDGKPREHDLHDWQHVFAYCDRVWQIRIAADNRFVKQYTSPLPWAMLTGGLCFTGLLSVLLLMISGQNAYIQAQIAARTAELEQANAELACTASNLRDSENRLLTLIESQPECVKTLDRNGRLLGINPAGLAMIEADSQDQIIGSEISRIVVVEHRARYEAGLARAFSGESINIEYEILTLKEHRRWMDSHAVPLRDSEGGIVGALVMTRDVSERKKAEDRLKLAARVFGEAHEGIVITDPTGAIVDVNPTFCDITGYSRDEILGKNPSILQSGRHSPDFYRDMWRDLNLNHHWHGEVWNRKKNGEFYAELLTISALCDENGTVLHFVGLFSDITQSKHQQQMLELLAHYDPLTRLPNRTLFADRLMQAIAHSRRTHSLLAICFLDLDGFKPVNDRFGHDAGDQVLIEVAERIKVNLREDDSVSRHGGDEFTLLIGSVHSLDECGQAIKRIHDAIAEPYFINGQVINIGVSTGITVYPLDNADADTLMRNADNAMYQAKLAGKNRYHFFDAGQNQQILTRNQELKAIETGFLNGEFRLFYQAKLDAINHRIIGAEALIRWQHPEQGLLGPLSFLPTIKGTSLEIAIGHWVIEEAWRQLCAWHAAGRTLEISINIAANHLLSPDFIDHLTQVLARNPEVQSRFLQLEILESSALDDLSAVDRVVGYCRDALGVTTALDDFGTGYSSLAHLRHLSVDAVKIDKSFVRDMLDDADDYAIVESVIGLSHAFRRAVIAEGVENCDQGAVLLLMGCNVLQGYLIAKPLAADDFQHWLDGFQPQTFRNDVVVSSFSVAQARIEILRINLRYWLKQIEECLHHPSVAASWPIMIADKSHFGRWLKQVRQQRLHDALWLDDLSALHDRVLAQAQYVMQRSAANDRAAVESGLQSLRGLQRQLDQQLADALQGNPGPRTG